MKRRRIVFVQTQAENAGAQEVSRLLGEQLTNRGHEVRHVFFYRKSEDFSAPPNTFIICDKRPSKAEIFSFLTGLYKFIKEFEPDCVFCFQHFGNVLGAPVARLAGCPVIVANQVTAPSLINPVLTALDKVFGVIGLYDSITVNSNFLLDAYTQRPKRYVEKLTLIPQGFETKKSDVDKATARLELGLPEDVALLGCSARLNPAKQLDKVIAILPNKPDWHFAIAGQGPDYNRLMELAAKHGVTSQVHFLGEFSPDRIGVFLASLDVFVFPSAAESFGLAAIEAAQVGVPVVANSLPVLQEVLQANGAPCALFADVSNTAEFSSAIETVLTDQDLANSLRDRSDDLKMRYSLDAMVDAYENLAVGNDVSFSTNEALAS
ncbi:glycosyltransferase family 4 protein [Labrenzia sp. PHM005]|uniref:glycosyltransferase family 4 protein n=1 Tax=Labrenzia sp. PHM005 TaxID=2590016 RepID=UPI0011403234|nr:glycosyltransferase family 4 protein [Labrenzia sp. PHM005]QDG76135.1 glycosyltransferase family 4 protein [Labrenzia sp. PHM005]